MSQTEVRVHRLLDHKHIIKLQKYLEDEDWGYLVMDYAGNLYSLQFTRKRPFKIVVIGARGIRYLYSNLPGNTIFAF